MKTKSAVILSLLVYLAINFSSGQKNYTYNGKNNLINIDIDKAFTSEPVTYSKLFSGFRIIPLETTENNHLGRIQKIKFVNDTFYVFDGVTLKTLFKFSKNGKYLGQPGKAGTGPGEYQYPTDFDVDSKKGIIYIYDNGSKSVLSYSSAGQYLKSVKTSNRVDNFVKSDNGFHLYEKAPKDPEANLLYFYNPDGLMLARNFSFIKYGFGINTPESTAGGNFYRSKKDIKFFMPFCDTIFSIAGDKISPFMVLNTKAGKITKEDLIRNMNKSSVMTFLDVDKIYKINNYCEFNNLASFQFGIGNRIFAWGLYSFNTQNFIWSTNREDDMTFIYPETYVVDDRHFAGIIFPMHFPKLQQVIRSGKIKLPSQEKERLLKLTEKDNPVVVIYDLREGEIKL